MYDMRHFPGFLVRPGSACCFGEGIGGFER